MQITTLNKTLKEISIKSIFNVGFTLTDFDFIASNKFKYDGGKYNPKVKEGFKSGDPKYRNVINNNIVWYESRRDKEGPYIQLMTVHTQGLNEVELYNYNLALNLLTK